MELKELGFFFMTPNDLWFFLFFISPEFVCVDFRCVILPLEQVYGYLFFILTLFAVCRICSGDTSKPTGTWAYT